MRFEDLIAQAERQLQAARERLAGYSTEQRSLLDGLAADASLTTEQQARFDELSTKKGEARAEITAAEQRVNQLRSEKDADDADQERSTEQHPGAEKPERGLGHVTNEARTYTAESAHRGVSFFRDAYRAEFKNDTKARARLARHERENEVDQQTRAIGTDGVGGLVIPIYLTELLVLPQRNGRVFANQVTNMPLPAEGMVMQIPRWTSGTTVTSQDGENTTISNTDVVDDTDLTVNINTIAGEQDISRQLFERGGADIDMLIYADLVEAYHAQIGAQTVSGTGSNHQHLGVTNTSGVPHAAAFGAAITGAKFYAKVAGAIASVASGKQAANEPPLRANAIFMHPRRWGWLQSLTDDQGRPLFNTKWNGPVNVLGMNLNPGAQSLYEADGAGDAPVGQMHGLPVFTDANVPTNVGTLNEDIVIVCDKTKTLLWEDGTGAPRELQFDQTNASKLQIKLQVYGYSGFTAGRRVSSLAIIGGADTTAGNGLIAPSLF
jgi:HK97 family phage major capsid protein